MIGVIILTFQSADMIEACLDSLRASDHADLRIVVCDNNSQDDTVDVIRSWAAGQGIDLTESDLNTKRPEEPGFLTLLHTGANRGFAGGVNAGIVHLQADPRIDLFWILNPDSEATPGAAGAYARCAERLGRFSLMGGRIRYHEAPSWIQSDGGRVSPWSGICRNLNAGLMPEDVCIPDVASLDFISGANMVASRRFIEQAGPMVEDYFLYYEEIDWAARRGDLPLALCPEAVVIHHGGTTIGTGSVTKRASPFANYFKNRNRMRFMRRFRPLALPVAWGLSMLRVVKIFAIGANAEAWSALSGLNGLPPPSCVRDRIAPIDRASAFKVRVRTR
jgi:GT2 family glycosyltransferase